MLNQAASIYNTQFFPGGVPNPNYPDPGDTRGYTGYLTEQYGVVLAFNSLIDPNPSARIQYAQYARNLLMYAMTRPRWDTCPARRSAIPYSRFITAPMVRASNGR